MRCPLNTPALLALGAALLSGCSVQAPGRQEAPAIAAPEAAPAPPALATSPSLPAPPPPPAPSVSAYAPAQTQSVTVTGSSIASPYAMARRAPAPGFVVIAPPQADKFPDKEANATQLVAEQPVSTFSADVDTASYAFVRRHLTGGRLPPPQAVRVEEMVNYFPYRYAAPKARNQPFAVTTEVMPSPWKPGNQLLHVAVRGFDVEQAERPPLNLVLLIDVSGSMAGPDRLPLLQQGLRLFADGLRENDRVSIVTYANGTQVVLEPTLGRDKQKIVDALDGLRASGGTAGGDGLQRAYALAERHRDPKAVNRVILATDGDFNIGITDPKQLERFIADKRKSGVYLSVFGVGMGNLNDALIQRLTQSGNGNAAYIDSLLEARKAMQEELGSTMFPIANDVKMQVEFNPKQVAAYRLIGYETRMLARQDFKDDKVDAGDMGAGHTVTAIYEITPASESGKLVDPLRYGENKKAAPAGRGDELCFVKVRYKLPGQGASRETAHAVRAASVRTRLDAAPEDARFAVAVAAFGQRLRGEAPVADYSYADIAGLANEARGKDPEGYRAEFVRLVRMAESLGKTNPVGQP